MSGKGNHFTCIKCMRAIKKQTEKDRRQARASNESYSLVPFFPPRFKSTIFSVFFLADMELPHTKLPQCWLE